MAFTRAIDFSAIQNALVIWVRTATGLPVIWNGQNRTQVAKPFAVLKKIAGPIKIGPDERRRRMDDDDLFTDIVGQRELVYNLQVFAASDRPGSSSFANADDYLATAQAALDHQTIAEAFRSAGMTVIEASGVTDLDAIEGVGFDSRASMDLRISVVSNLVPAEDQPTNYIETAEADGDAGAIDTSEG